MINYIPVLSRVAESVYSSMSLVPIITVLNSMIMLTSVMVFVSSLNYLSSISENDVSLDKGYE